MSNLTPTNRTTPLRLKASDEVTEYLTEIGSQEKNVFDDLHIKRHEHLYKAQATMNVPTSYASRDDHLNIQDLYPAMWGVAHSIAALHGVQKMRAQESHVSIPSHEMYPDQEYSVFAEMLLGPNNDRRGTRGSLEGRIQENGDKVAKFHATGTIW